MPDICTAQIVDTMLAQHLLQPELPHDLQFVASIFTNKPAVWKSGDKSEPGYWEWRNARDTDVTLQCGKVLLPMLKQQGLYDLYSLVQVPLARICHLMHETGFKTDPGRIKEVREKLFLEMEAAEKLLPEKLRTHLITVQKRKPAPAGTVGKSGKPVKYIHVPAQETVVPWRSDEILHEYLYGELQLPVQLHVKTKKPTVDKIARMKLERHCRREEKFDTAKHIATIGKLKSMSTLISGFLQESKGGVGIIHANFNVHGTATGRLSSSDPNLQNQPEAARYIYVPSHSDWQLVQFDYSGAENMLTAYFAGDSDRLARLQTPGFSEHKHNAEIFFGIPYSEIEKSSDPDSPYKKAKIITHGLDKGEGYLRIANTNDLDTKEVRDLVDLWKRHNQTTVQWQQRVGKEAEKEGVLTNPFGRKRWFWSSNLYTEALAQPAQSTTADIIYRAMIALMYERIGWPREKVMRIAQVIKPLPHPAQLLVQVHDSLVIQSPKSLVDEVVETVTRVMTQGWPELGGLSIPVEVEVAEPGESWGEMHKYLPLACAA